MLVTSVLSEKTFSGGTRLSGPINTARWPIPSPRARQACPSELRRDLFRRDPLRRDPLVGSVLPEKTFSGGACLSGPLFGGTFFGGTRLSGPFVNIRCSIAFRRGLKSRGESGAKAPHSIWSAAIYRRFPVKASAFTTLPMAVFCRNHGSAPLVGAIHEWPNKIGGTCSSRPSFNVGSSVAFRRGLKSRAESGAKAPHSISRRAPLVGRLLSITFGQSAPFRRVPGCVSPWLMAQAGKRETLEYYAEPNRL
ncbi:hypothetical protein THTE_0420 [Thermogutta terrifontis]|uniref:Uncharacterized protein n=1 Tax=Thermogutta terrifontis TaxID=1331910 RepID=A0A286RAN3_9BACT|nr:hypothetical protein THTE_0420 [Thermogutta terrifontis]